MSALDKSPLRRLHDALEAWHERLEEKQRTAARLIEAQRAHDVADRRFREAREELRLSLANVTPASADLGGDG